MEDREERLEMEIAEAVREACLQRALHAYEDAGIAGLCAEGRWDVAVDAIRRLDLAEVVAAAVEEGS